MIEAKCANCGKSFQVKDELAGKTGKCKNCGEPMTIPAAAGAEVHQPADQAQPQVVVQVQQQPAGDMIGPADKSVILVILLNGFTLQYFYLGQTMKGVVFLLIDLFVMLPLVFLTCGLGLALYIPYHIVILIDSIMITGRLKREAIGPWKFF